MSDLLTPSLIADVTGDSLHLWESMQQGLRTISETQIYHQRVITHTSFPENLPTCTPSPPSDEVKSGVPPSPSPDFVKWCRKRAKEGHAPRCLSACVFGADLLWNFIYQPSSICQWKGKEVKGGGAIAANSQPPLPSQMHNSVFLSQQAALGRA